MEQTIKTDKLVLDACCGGRMMWFDKSDPRALFIDIREAPNGVCPERPGFSVKPDMIADFRDLPFPDRTFKLIAWDPPHILELGETSIMCKKFGSLKTDTWRWDLSKGFNELWRVLDVNGTLVMKWNEESILLSELLKCFKEKPLFGHTTGSKSKTHWLCFFKSNKGVQNPETENRDTEINEPIREGV